ncbi:MAG: NADH oxidase [Fluviicola sp. XM-24bin1]|nr:MAG: NADH oxidase [Fluviicola sp. XM-24bin1]
MLSLAQNSALMKYITPLEYKERQNNNDAVLLDIREPYELDICTIGGLHIPMAEVASRASEIDQSKEVIVLCRSGKRAESVANLLVTDLEFPNVSIFEGGILAWIDQVDSSLEAY